MTPQHHLPADIERTSFRIITEELDMMGLTPPPEHEAVVKRVIHTTADFDYARNLRFTPHAASTTARTCARRLRWLNTVRVGSRPSPRSVCGRPLSLPSESSRVWPSIW